MVESGLCNNDDVMLEVKIGINNNTQVDAHCALC